MLPLLILTALLCFLFMLLMIYTPCFFSFLRHAENRMVHYHHPIPYCFIPLLLHYLLTPYRSLLKFQADLPADLPA